jgi:hypothetical protein
MNDEQSKPTAPAFDRWCYDVSFAHQRLHAFHSATERTDRCAGSILDSRQEMGGTRRGLAGAQGDSAECRRSQRHSRKTTDASGILVFDVPAGRYIVLGFGDQPATITVESGRAVKLKLVVH